MQRQITEILQKYPHARETTQFKGPHVISELFNELKKEFSELDLIRNNKHLVVKSSYGKGNWAKVPWLAVLDTRETSTTQKGTYIVLLFREDGHGCHLKLAQGVTDVKNAYGVKAPEVLKGRADELRGRLLPNGLPEFDLSADGKLGGHSAAAQLYDASTICSKYFAREAIPTDSELTGALESLLGVYERFIQTQEENATSESSKTNNSGRRYWALSAGEGGSRWENFVSNNEIAIGWDGLLANLDTLSSREEVLEQLMEKQNGEGRPTNDALCCHQFNREISIGDVVVAKVGSKRILGVGVVTSDYFFDEKAKTFQHKRKVRWEVTNGSEFPGTGTAYKTLTEITPYPGLVAHIRSLLGEYDSSENQDDEESPRASYSVDEIIDEGCFLPGAQVSEAIERLKLKKNLILQGPPGTGKTWLAKRLAYALIGAKSRSLVRTTQFHANLTYEDFIRGYRPNSAGNLSLVDGAFMSAIEDARNTSRPIVFVIEEINRGNPAQIFGEFLTLLEADKRDAEEALELTYRRSENERVSVPPNFYVIGTMNLADRSLALMDMALRRRFAFVSLTPNLDKAWRDWICDRCGVPQQLASAIESGIRALNATIEQDPNLGPQFMIGHSYVTPSPDSSLGDAREWYRQVVETELRPLLEEYWFDDRSRTQKEVDALLSKI